MKRYLSLLLATTFLIVSLMLTGCGKNETDNKEDANNGVAVNESKVQSSELYDISDDKISTLERDEDYKYTKVSEEKRITMLTQIPEGIKKAVGETESCTMQTPGGQGTYTLNLKLKVNSEEDFTTLTNYYKTLGGTVTGEQDLKLSKTFYMDFDWGKIFQCDYDKKDNEVQVSISIN